MSERRTIRFQSAPGRTRRIRAYVEDRPHIGAYGDDRALALYALMETFPQEFGVAGFKTDFPFHTEDRRCGKRF